VTAPVLIDNIKIVAWKFFKKSSFYFPQMKVMKVSERMVMTAFHFVLTIGLICNTLIT